MEVGMEPNALGVFLYLLLTIGIMLAGVDIITSLHPTLHKSWRWMFRGIVLRPARLMGREIRRELGRLLRWGGVQLLRFLRWCLWQMGRGARRLWVWITT